ncbi:FG-GAP repeat domain-containing protein [Actinomadura logoneensis]|uniref:FG-GAP repeat domain-containing protein n=1 Tax=Actinomadura logoneensis TaxID=2293572 RepID=UPI001314DDCB|nr:VCBS repeat-containing protein [Actinomadura logoneensis]
MRTRNALAATALAAAASLTLAGDITRSGPIAQSADLEAGCVLAPHGGGISSAPSPRAPRGRGRPVTGAVDRGGDFNGDGLRDTAVAVPFRTTDAPGRTLPGRWSGAYVAVVYSGPGGPDPARRQVITHDCLDVPTRGRPDHVFGTTLGSADFDRDGFDDLVVGGQDGGYNGLGPASVTVIYGSADGLTGRSVEMVVERTQSFFGTVAIGDFGGDGALDIAATPGSFGDLYLFRDVVDRPVTAERSALIRRPPHGRGAEDSYESLQVADFNADGRSDLAVMVDWSSEGERRRQWGELRLGGAEGLSERATVFGRDRIGLQSMAGDVTGDGRPDLVTREGSRSMSVVPGTRTGLGDPQRFTIPLPPGPVNQVPSPDLPSSLGFAVGDVTGDRTADVVVSEGGRVAVLPGGPAGVRSAQADIVEPDGRPQPSGGDARWLGGGLSVGDLTGDGEPELTVGAPEWSSRAGGRLYILPGGRTSGSTTLSGVQLGLTQRPSGGFGQVLLP